MHSVCWTCVKRWALLHPELSRLDAPLLHGPLIGHASTPGRARTCNMRFWRPLLCHLSYRSIKAALGIEPAVSTHTRRAPNCAQAAYSKIKTRTFPCGAIDAHPDGYELLRNRRTDYVASRLRAEVARTAKEGLSLYTQPQAGELLPCVRLLPWWGTALWRRTPDSNRAAPTYGQPARQICVSIEAARETVKGSGAKHETRREGRSGDCVHRFAFSALPIIP